jgi:hypothetical protein
LVSVFHAFARGVPGDNQTENVSIGDCEGPVTDGRFEEADACGVFATMASIGRHSEDAVDFVMSHP